MNYLENSITKSYTIDHAINTVESLRNNCWAFQKDAETMRGYDKVKMKMISAELNIAWRHLHTARKYIREGFARKDQELKRAK